jgi:hypothetical protein
LPARLLSRRRGERARLMGEQRGVHEQYAFARLQTALGVSIRGSRGRTGGLTVSACAMKRLRPNFSMRRPSTLMLLVMCMCALAVAGRGRAAGVRRELD